jgi:hypothetical protein
MVIPFPSWELCIAWSKKFFKANVLEFWVPLLALQAASLRKIQHLLRRAGFETRQCGTTTTKKADVAERPEAFDHVGLLRK